MRQKTRAKKVVGEGSRPPRKEKFVDAAVSDTGSATQPVMPRLEPSNQNQRILLGYLREGRKVVIAQGSAGCGKSYVAAYHAANLMKQKKVDKIILVRANVSVGKSLGMLPGTLSEKLLPFFAQTLAHLTTFMGKGFVTYCQHRELIVMQSIEHMRGLSIENAFVIVEESQGLTASEFEMILSRIGDGCQMVFTGDEKQSDIKGVNGLSSTIEMINKAVEDQPDYLTDEDLTELDENVGVVIFTPDDVVRSGLCKAFVRLYYYQ
jgi:phosphate starvation-inducible PhoH-like protein